jgi:hypothetical protein
MNIQAGKGRVEFASPHKSEQSRGELSKQKGSTPAEGCLPGSEVSLTTGHTNHAEHCTPNNFCQIPKTTS